MIVRGTLNKLSVNEIGWGFRDSCVYNPYLKPWCLMIYQVWSLAQLPVSSKVIIAGVSTIVY